MKLELITQYKGLALGFEFSFEDKSLMIIFLFWGLYISKINKKSKL